MAAKQGSSPKLKNAGKKKRIVADPKVNVMDFDSIPRTQTGKARRVIDQRPKQI